MMTKKVSLAQSPNTLAPTTKTTSRRMGKADPAPLQVSVSPSEAPHHQMVQPCYSRKQTDKITVEEPSGGARAWHI